MTQTDSSSKRLRVLIADDVQETRRSVRLMLSLNPDVLVVAIANNGRQAVEMAKEHHPDLLVMDVNMPELTGLAAFKEISQMYPDTGCIIISAERDPNNLGMAMSIGAQEFLIKPFSIDDLNEAVSRVSEQVYESRKKLANADR